MVNAPELSFRGAKRRGNLAVPSPITGQPRRNRNCLPEIAAAPSGPRNDKSGGIAPLNLCRDHCHPAWRSGSAATDARNWSMRFYRQPRRNRNCLPEIAASACGLLAMTIRGWCHFNANLYRLFLQSRAGLLIVQKRCPALELQSGAGQISFLRRRPSYP